MSRFFHTLFCILMLSALPAQAYKKKAPPFLMVEVETRDGETLKGQLYFEKLLVTLEVMDSSGKVVEKSSTLGIKSLTPMGQRSIQIRRVDDKQWSFRLVMPKAADRKLRLNMTSFPLGVMDKVNRDKVVTNGLHDAGITGLELDHRKPAAALIDAPIKLLLDKRSDLDDLPVESIKAIRFLYAGNDYKREFPTGRFVGYSKQAKGDNGTVQPVAATFCGGALGAEHFFGGGFLRDNRITVTGDFVELDFLKGVKATRIGGNDPADDAYRGDPGRDRKGRPLPSPRRAPVIVEYSSDLSKIVGVTRLPWASLYADKMVIAADDGVVLHGEPGPTFAGIEKTAGAVHTVENPDAVAYAKSKGRTPRRDSVMLKVSGDREKIDWVVRFKHGGLTFDAQPDGRLVVQRGRQIFYVQPDGKVTDGPRIDLSSSKTGVHVDPRDGSFYFGGEYHSATGLEPWRNPWLHKLKPNGDFDWTAYNWTGPIVGVQPLRLVSESAVRDMRVGADGSILIKGWSDGGNSVFGRQPYDLRKRVPHSGFASSTWGARVLSVTHFVRIDGDTQEAYGHTNIMTYLALDDEPNSLNVDDFDSTASGHFVFTGGSASGLIETHDAWVKSWWVDYQTNPYAQARGGTYFAVYHGDMSKPRMTTVLPGVTEQQIEIKGDMVLLFGSAAKFATAYGINTPAIIKNATQAEFGGGHNDAYVMLINCKAKGTLTKVPAMTWAKADLATVPE